MSLPREPLEELAREFIASADRSYGIQEAVKWAGGFEFPQNLVDSDMRLFRASQLDFIAMVRRRLKKIGATRMSACQVEQLRPDNPERRRLLDIASGMRVPSPVGFVPNGMHAFETSICRGPSSSGQDAGRLALPGPSLLPPKDRSNHLY